jgi:peptidoglycan/LPS O-acetylase OafA/YrhL
MTIASAVERPPASHPTSALEALLAGPHLPALDGLRAFSVLLVILFHFGWSGVPGDLGVLGFFVLSGFLITWLLLREHERDGTISLRSFYARRTLRIVPAYLVFVLVSVTWDLLRGDDRSRPVIVPALTYLVNYYNALHDHPSNSLAHTWSLAIEEQFYLMWPLLFLGAMSAGRRRVAWVLGGSIAVVVLWRSWLYLGGRAGEAYVYNAFDTRFDNLAVGCLLAVLLTAPTFARRVSAWRPPTWYPLATMACLFASRSLTPSAYHFSVGFTVDAVLVAVLITQLLLLHDSTAWRWLDQPVTRYFGALSYSLYLYHSYGNSVARLFPGLPEPVALLVSIAGATLLAMGSYHFIEKPFLRLRARFVGR